MEDGKGLERASVDARQKNRLFLEMKYGLIATCRALKL